MEDSSPIKNNKGTSSRVIDSLHSNIDDLKQELDSVRISHDDYKKKYTNLVKKNDLFVDQLANAKHENDMINALLKRKERRITDLEDQYNDLCSGNESLKLNFKNMKIRCDNLQESSASNTAEYERLKIAYDALIASQMEYKRHYLNELLSITNSFESYKKSNEEKLLKISEQFQSNDKDVDTLLDSLTNKKRALETLYVNKNRTVLELLDKLSKVAKLHGQELKSILMGVTETLEELLTKYPDVPNKILEHESIEVDIQEILGESNETLLANCSFDEELTLVNSPDMGSEAKMKGQQQLGQNQNQSNGQLQANRRRKNKRQSLRIDSNNAPDFSSINTPTGQPQLNLPKRGFSVKTVESRLRSTTPPAVSNNNNNNNSNNNNNNNNNNSNNSYHRRNFSSGGYTHNNYNNHNNHSHNYNNNNNNNNNHYNPNSNNSNNFNNHHNTNTNTTTNSNNNTNSSNPNSNSSHSNNKSKRRSMYGNNKTGGYGNFKGNRQSFHEQQQTI